MLYIAYGSNLDVTQMQERCPDARYICRMELEGYKLAFNRYATITKAKGSTVPIIVYELTARDENTLDLFEGVRVGAYKKHYINIEVAGETVSALVYIKELGKRLDPSFTYIQKILGAYRFWGFDKLFPKQHLFLQETKQIIEEEYSNVRSIKSRKHTADYGWE